MEPKGYALLCALCLAAQAVSAADPEPTLEASSFGGAGSLATNSDFTLISSWRQQVQTSVSSGGEYVHFSGFVGAFTDPQVMLDTDGDGLTDIEEVTGNRFTPAQPTSPTVADTDGDGVSDYAELVMGTNPLDASSSAAIASPNATNGLASGFQLTVATVPGRRVCGLASGGDGSRSGNVMKGLLCFHIRRVPVLPTPRNPSWHLTRPSRPGCNPTPSWAGSVRLGR